MASPTRSAPNRPARLNRTLLALIGLGLLAAGGGTLAFGLGLLRDVAPGLDPTVPLLPAQLLLPTWVPYAVIAAAVLVGLGCLRWLLAQALRKPKTSTWALAGGSGRGTTRLDTDHAADAAAADITGYRGVAKATATLTGPRTQPALHLVVHTETGTEIGPLRERITTHALPRLRRALELDTLQADLLLRIDTNTPASRTR